jgi:hypothetical protein
MAEAIDFSRSFLWWRVDTDKLPPGTVTVPPPYALNNARVPLDCLATVTETATDRRRQFALGVSCKTEAVGAESDIWPQPNADFKPVLSDDGQMLGIKTYDIVGRQLPFVVESLGMQPERLVSKVSEVFESARTDVERVDAEPLMASSAAVEAILANRRLVARTAYGDERYRVELEYPVKTVNANERDTLFQPDTGPVLVPDLECELDDLIGSLQLAYVAFHQFDWSELLVRVPVPVAEGVEVHHYARSMRLDCRNQLLALS